MLDEKARLNIFGLKINIIDFYILLFILCLVPMIGYGYKILTKPKLFLPPQICFNLEEYEQEQTAIKKQISKLKQAIAERDRIRNNFLKEYKRARKHF